MLIEQGQLLWWLYAVILLFFPSPYSLEGEKLESFIHVNPEVQTFIVIIKNQIGLNYETTWEQYNNLAPEERDQQDIFLQPLYDLNQLRDLIFHRYYSVYPPNL